MTIPDLRWSILPDRKAMIALQAFACTTSRPRSPHGRKLNHPRQWELDAQSLLRHTSQAAGRDDQVLVAVSENDSLDDGICAAAWCESHMIDSTPATFIKACGVGLEFRGQGGSVADDLMKRILRMASRQSDGLSVQHVIVHGNVHVENIPSERLFTRFGFEPVGLPLRDYQKWSLHYYESDLASGL